MSYHLTVLREKSGQSDPIGLDEFVAASLKTNQITVKNAQPLAEVSIDGEPPSTLHLQDGEIWCKAGSERILVPMLELARALGGRLRGDEGETYSTEHETFLHPLDAALVKGSRVGFNASDFIRAWRLVRWVLLLIGIVIAYTSRR